MRCCRKSHAIAWCTVFSGNVWMITMEIPEVFALRTTSKGHSRGRSPLAFIHVVEQESDKTPEPQQDHIGMRGETNKLSSKHGNHFGPERLWLVLGFIWNVYILGFLEGFEAPGSLLTSRTFVRLNQFDGQIGVE